MQEESRWRYALAQQIASHSHAHPQMAAVLVEGSVARDYADRSSDIDLAVFWAEPPTAQERRDIVTRAGGSYRHPSPSTREAAGWETRNVREGVAIDVRHTTVKATEGILAAVLERADPSLSKQQHLAALRAALPLVNPTLITRWQQQAAAYPHALALAMVRAHLRFRPAWEQEQLAERHEVLVLYDSFCTAQKHLFFSNRDRMCEDGLQKRLLSRKTSGWTERPSRPCLLCVRSPDGRGSEHMLYCSGTVVFGTVWG